MYEEVAFLGLNLMYFDKNNNSEMKRYIEENQSDFVESATIAENVKNNYQIEFYKLKNESNAKSMFEGNKEIFERQKVSNIQYQNVLII